MWYQRYLTPIGKVTVIKTLALSKLNHLFLALPNPKKELLKKIENMFYKFIWNGKPDKIRRQILTNLYLEGGMNMIDITHFISALKITWGVKVVCKCRDTMGLTGKTLPWND